MEPFTILTPTGDRPRTFKLCEYYVLRQSIQPKEWIVIDDGIESLPIVSHSFLKYIRRDQKETDGNHTLPIQLINALQYVTTDLVIIFEDDDWYRSDYCEQILKLFEKHGNASLIGQAQSIYYHLSFRKYYPIGNLDRASLCQTAFRSSLIPTITHICESLKNPFVDLQLWKSVKSNFLLKNEAPMCIGMKGLPGRHSNTTMGHKGTASGFRPDPNLCKLKELIGNDVTLYEDFMF